MGNRGLESLNSLIGILFSNVNKFSIIGVLIISSCRDEPIEEKSIYQPCNDLLAEYCAKEIDGEFCLYGYKWGDDNPFHPAGLEVVGPGTSGNMILFKFGKGGALFDTHAEVDRISVSIDDLRPCYRDTIVAALNRWESVCGIEFREVDIEESSHMKFVFGNIRQSGIGYPAFTDELCKDISGFVIFKDDNLDCNLMYRLALHEIGHSLGLGHVSSSNVMNRELQEFQELQEGDITGAQSIYGN